MDNEEQPVNWDQFMTKAVEDPFLQSKVPRLWRIYFTNRDFFPHLGALDNGTIKSQIHVQWVAIRGTVLNANTDMGKDKSETIHHNVFSLLRSDRKGKPNEPIWWLECHAVAVFRDGGVELIGSES